MQEKITDYHIVRARNMPLLEDGVKQLISVGWIPQGSVVIVDGLWVQAMVRLVE